MSDAMCEDYQRAKENRVRQMANKHEPFYWWEYPEPFEIKATTKLKINPSGLARSRQELRERNGIE